VLKELLTAIYLLFFEYLGLSITTYAAPFSIASSANSLPSNRSPFNAKKIQFFSIFLVSVVIYGYFL